MEIPDKSHLSVLICSLDKIYKKATFGFKLNASELYYLDIVYKFLNNEYITITDDESVQLNNIYGKIYSYSKNICKVPLVDPYTQITTPTFTQAEVSDCATLPIQQDLIYYWQEPLGVTSSTIINNISVDNTFFANKSSDFKTTFELGKDITYTNIGLIAFSITNSTESSVYKIYDILNIDVTDTFESFYDLELNMRIFISMNIYSNGIMNFKIKKI